MDRSSSAARSRRAGRPASLSGREALRACSGSSCRGRSSPSAWAFRTAGNSASSRCCRRTNGSEVLTIPEQVERGILVCPVTREKLVLRYGELESVDTKRRYDVVEGVPILLAAEGQVATAASSRMVAEYERAGRTARSSRTSEKLRELLARDYRTAESLS